MSRPSPQVVFDFLSKTKHSLNEGQERTLFSTEAENSNNSYWLFSDIYNLYQEPYLTFSKNNEEQIWNAFAQSNKNFGKATKTFPIYSEHVIRTTGDYSIITPTGTQEHKNFPDLKLSQYACWSLLNQWGDLIFSQLYFIYPDKKFSELANMAHHFSRAYLRDNLARQERIIQGIAHKNHADMRIFNNTMHKAYFYSWDTEAIKNGFQIPVKNNDPIANYMTAYSLHAKTNALNNAIKKLDSNPRLRFETFVQTLTEELYQARIKVMQKTNLAPEQSISRIHVNKVKSELHDLEKNFFANAASKKIKTL